MTMAMKDTTIQAEQARLSALRAMSPAKRLTLALGWSQAVRDLCRQGLKREFPQATEMELQRLLADRLLGPELATKAYGPLNAHG